MNCSNRKKAKAHQVGCGKTSVPSGAPLLGTIKRLKVNLKGSDSFVMIGLSVSGGKKNRFAESLLGKCMEVRLLGEIRGIRIANR